MERNIAIAKLTTPTYRIERSLKVAAEREHRSIANMVEILIRDYCGRNGIAIPEQTELFEDGQKFTSGKNS